MTRRIRVLTVACATAVMATGFASRALHAQEEKGKAKAQAPEETPAGAWDGTADTPQGPQAFSLTLKVEGEKVTGEITLPEGTVPFAEGTWAKGELALSFEHPAAGPISLAGALKEGKLEGTYQMGQGEGGAWQAVRRPAATGK